MNKLRLTQKILSGAPVLAISVILPITQIGVLTAQAYSPASAPISNPISAPEVSPSPTPTTEPISGPISTPEPTTTPTNAPNNDHHDSDSHSDNGGGNSSGSSCNPEKPKSVPTLVSWESIGKNQIRLHWTKAQNPVNYYLVNYGLKPHTPIYGNPNVGDQNITSTVIGGLSGATTYYFSVAAGHDCVHSDNSNEIAVKINGSKINTPVAGFASTRVLSASKTGKVTYTTSTPEPTPSNQNQSQTPEKHSDGFFSNLAHFFGNFFRH